MLRNEWKVMLCSGYAGIVIRHCVLRLTKLRIYHMCELFIGAIISTLPPTPSLAQPKEQTTETLLRMGGEAPVTVHSLMLLKYIYSP